MEPAAFYLECGKFRARRNRISKMNPRSYFYLFFHVLAVLKGAVLYLQQMKEIPQELSSREDDSIKNIVLR